MEHELTIVPVLNKIDLPIAGRTRSSPKWSRPSHRLRDVLRVSAKAGLGIDEVLQAIITRVPPPAGRPDEPLRALVYNSHFDTYKGVVVYVRIRTAC